MNHVAILLALVSLGAGEPARIAIVRAAAFVVEREWVRVFVQVEPHADNRAFILAAVDEGGAIVSRTFKPLEGADAARSWWIDWKEGLPAGELELVAILETTKGQGPRARRPIRVLSVRSDHTPQ